MLMLSNKEHLFGIAVCPLFRGSTVVTEILSIIVSYTPCNNNGSVARIDMRSVRLVFWDIGGQEDLQSLWDKACTHNHSIAIMIICYLQYYSEAHGVIYVIDSCDPENLTISAQTFSESQITTVEPPIRDPLR